MTMKNWFLWLIKGIATKFASAKTIAEMNISNYAMAFGLRVVGSPLGYLRSERVVRLNGKKITILGFDGKAMVEDGFYLLLDSGGFGFFLGDVIIYDVGNEEMLSQNDFGFFLNHEIGHILHGDAWAIWRNILTGKQPETEGLYIDSKQEIAADRYALSKGFAYPDFDEYMQKFYSRVGGNVVQINEAMKLIHETHKERFSFWKK